MIIVLTPHSTTDEIRHVEDNIRELGYEPHVIRGVVRTVIAAVGDETTQRSLEILAGLPMVEKVIPIQKRYKLVSREASPETTRVRVGPHEIGGPVFHVMAGPCSVESLDQTLSTARAVARAGATFLRGGAFKPRTSPYDFQGLGNEALDILRKAREVTGLPVVSEVIRETDLPRMVESVDILQIGARNALNYSLLEAIAGAHKPVLLKRGSASTVEEWLLAAEYLAKNGNPNVILCERGIRTFEKATRNTLDLSAVALAKLECNLPVIVDPSHAAGRHDLIKALSCAAVAVGADGLIIEVHEHPEEACSDGPQQLTHDQFSELMQAIQPFVVAAGRRLTITPTPPT
jgi:3-deoxy-7-phosphoheptulonate synthase